MLDYVTIFDPSRPGSFGKYKSIMAIGSDTGIRVRDFKEVRLDSCSPEHFFPEEDMVPGSMSLVV